MPKIRKCPSIQLRVKNIELEDLKTTFPLHPSSTEPEVRLKKKINMTDEKLSGFLRQLSSDKQTEKYKILL